MMIFIRLVCEGVSHKNLFQLLKKKKVMLYKNTYSKYFSSIIFTNRFMSIEKYSVRVEFLYVDSDIHGLF